SCALAQSIAAFSNCGLMPASAGVLRGQSAPGNVCACAASGVTRAPIRIALNRIGIAPSCHEMADDSTAPPPAKCVLGAHFLLSTNAALTTCAAGPRPESNSSDCFSP